MHAMGFVGRQTFNHPDGGPLTSLQAPDGGFHLVRLDRLFYKGEVPGGRSHVQNPAFTCRRCLLQKQETHILLPTHNIVEEVDTDAGEDHRGMQWFGSGTIATRYREANGDSYEALLVDAAVNVVVEFDDDEQGECLFDGFARRVICCAFCDHGLGWQHTPLPPSLQVAPLEAEEEAVDARPLIDGVSSVDAAHGVLDDVQDIRSKVLEHDQGLESVGSSLAHAVSAMQSLNMGRGSAASPAPAPADGFGPSPPISSGARQAGSASVGSGDLRSNDGEEGGKGAVERPPTEGRVKELAHNLLDMLPSSGDEVSSRAGRDALEALIQISAKIGNAGDEAGGQEMIDAELEEGVDAAVEACRKCRDLAMTRGGQNGGTDLGALLDALAGELSGLRAWRIENARRRSEEDAKCSGGGPEMTGDACDETGGDAVDRAPTPTTKPSSPTRRPSLTAAGSFKDHGAAAVTRGTRNAPYRLADGTWVRPKTAAAASGGGSFRTGGGLGSFKSTSSSSSPSSSSPPRKVAAKKSLRRDQRRRVSEWAASLY